MLRLALVLGLLSLPAWAAPSRYALDPEGSAVGFTVDFGKDHITGRMPVGSAELALDFDNVAASSVTVALDVGHASASFPFAAQAMKGPKVLDAAQYPQIVFHSTRIRREGDGVRIEGEMTIRGVTRPAELFARFYRPEGSAPGDRNHLAILLTGALNRSDFGATGWSDMVGDAVELRIVAQLSAVN